MKLQILAFCLFLSLPLAACNESFTAGDDAGEITFDASFPDAGSDAGAVDNTGEPCRGDMDCVGVSDTCIDELAGGYCSTTCASDEDCGPDSTCVQVGRGTFICLDRCDPGGTDECRPGYGCSQGMVNVCLEGCEEDADCDDGTECELGGGFSGAGRCFTPGGEVGDACTSSEQCPEGNSFCADEEQAGFPGGYCIQFGCDLESGGGCAEGDVCLPGFRGGWCYAGCEDDDECRDGYECQPDVRFADRQSCQPAFVPEDLGQVCSAGRGRCNGFCLSEGQTGWPDSYCVATGCDPEGDSSDCPGDGVCLDIGEDGGICLDGCATDGDCRPGYDCGPSNAEDPDSPRACVPGCDADLVCGNDEFECNTGTGLCTEPFVATNLGEPCAAGGDTCVGGRCLDEEDEGWPAGMCTFPGCRLRGEGRAADCPADTACVDDGTGDPDLGVCAPTCTEGSCRTGYGCLPVDPATSDGPMACQPACSADSCSGGRSCDAESGRCE